MATIEESDPNEKVLLVKAASGQVEDIVDVQLHTGVSVFKIDASGNLSATQTIGVVFVIDGGGSAIQASTKGWVVIPFAGNITAWEILADVGNSSIVIDVKRCTYANFPSTVSIAGSEKPTITSAVKNQDTSLTTWTTALATGDILEFYVDSATNVTKATLSISIVRSV
jgi:hypothetical protein